jgi:thioredoxin reductase (NADPH)
MITVDLLRRCPLFETLPTAELETLAARGADIRLRAGDWLIHEGEVASFFVLLEGRIEVHKVIHGVDRLVTTYAPGVYFGEVPLLLGSPAVASLRAVEPARVCAFEAADFRELIAGCRYLNSELLKTMATRIGHLQEITSEPAAATVTIIGHRFDLACHHVRDFLARNHIAFKWLDPTRPCRRRVPATHFRWSSSPTERGWSRRRCASWRRSSVCRPSRRLLPTTSRSSVRVRRASPRRCTAHRRVCARS